MRQWILMCALLSYSVIHAQISVQGKITNSSGDPIYKAHIDLGELFTTTDQQGYFLIQIDTPHTYPIRIQKEGFMSLETQIVVSRDTIVSYMLWEYQEELEEIIVQSPPKKADNRQSLSQEDLHRNYGGSLAASLAQIAGLEAMAIGSQNAKPSMRGLGFNRLAVVENGFKQEGQQWGADHGLEMDALQTEKVEVIKGTGTIAYGSDAIAGVLQINNEGIPSLGTHGMGLMNFQSNNQSVATSFHLTHRVSEHFFKWKASYVDYADFIVPTQEIVYLNTRIPLQKGWMTNTAGKEANAFFQWGYLKDNFKSILTWSLFDSESGFFAGAHGIPSIENTQSDDNRRDIALPLQTAKHFKFTYHALWDKIHTVWDFRTAYQRNHRQEKSVFHTHYPNMVAPIKNPDVELDFLLQTWDTQLAHQYDWNFSHQTRWGIQYQYQDNSVDGYSYLLPKYHRTNVALFTMHQWDISDKNKLEWGIRADYFHLSIFGFFDGFLYEYLYEKGYEENQRMAYAQRSQSVDKSYFRANYSLGYSFYPSSKWRHNITIASHFRMPNAMELSANGLHHGAFRHEQGNPNLKVESGWAWDWNTSFENTQWKLNASAYLYYFSNYIFLKPSGQFSILPHGGQVYQYDQSKAWITGVEWDISYTWNQWRFQTVWEFLYNQQLGEIANYPLPFSTPINAQAQIAFIIGDDIFFKKNEITFHIKKAWAQHRIAPNELPTSGYTIFDLQWNSHLSIGNVQPYCQVGIQNLFNTQYFLHNSFYRALEIPAWGRSITFLLKIPF